MELFGYPIWMVLVICIGVFSIAGQYIGAGLALKNGSKIVRPVILIVILLLAGKVLCELLGIL